jgi:hypothetical protein
MADSTASRSDNYRNGFWVQKSSGGDITKSILASGSNPQ